jgi:hypothetical protein
VPTVADKAVVKALKDETSPFVFFVVNFPATIFKECLKFEICKNLKYIVKKSPVGINNANIA